VLKTDAEKRCLKLMLKNDARNNPKLSVLTISSVMRCGVVGGGFDFGNYFGEKLNQFF